MLIVEVYLKFYSQAAIAKSKYTVTLKPYEAVNWFNVFSTHHFEVTSYQGNLLNKINNAIHQQFI